jgi:hypothetical protein
MKKYIFFSLNLNSKSLIIDTRNAQHKFDFSTNSNKKRKSQNNVENGRIFF